MEEEGDSPLFPPNEDGNDNDPVVVGSDGGEGNESGGDAVIIDGSSSTTEVDNNNNNNNNNENLIEAEDFSVGQDEENDKNDNNSNYINNSSNNNNNKNMDEEMWKDDDFLSFGDTNEPKKEQSSTEESMKETSVIKGSSTLLVQDEDEQQDDEDTNFPPWMTLLQQQQQQQNNYNESPQQFQNIYNNNNINKRGRQQQQQQQQYKQQPHPMVQLHNEIVCFTQLMEPTAQELNERHDLVDRVKTLVQQTFSPQYNPTVQVFGSLATGLFLPTSDIDLVILIQKNNNNNKNNNKTTTTENPFSRNNSNTNLSNTESSKQLTNGEKGEEEEENDNNNNHNRHDDENNRTTAPGDPENLADHNNNNNEKENDDELDEAQILHQLANALREEWLSELSYLEVIENTRVPLVKFTHLPTNVNVDISINQESGTVAAQLMQQYIQALPPLRPLAYVLKYFLSVRALNEPYTGGVGSFLLQLMIVAYLQQRQREAIEFWGMSQLHQSTTTNGNLQQNLGILLLEFLTFFGTQFNYLTTGISVLGNGSFFAKGEEQRKDIFWKQDRLFHLAMENPLDTNLDVGAPSFRIQMVQRAFFTAYKILLTQLVCPELLTTTMTTTTTTGETCPPISSSSMSSTTYGILASILPPTPDLFARAREQRKIVKAQVAARAVRVASSSRQAQQWGRNDLNNNKGNNKNTNNNNNNNNRNLSGNRSNSKKRKR